MGRKKEMKYILSYGARFPAKLGPVSAYYDEDIERLERILELAAKGRPIERELTSVIASGVQFVKEQGEEIDRLQRALRAAQWRTEELELERSKALTPRWFSGTYAAIIKKARRKLRARLQEGFKRKL